MLHLSSSNPVKLKKYYGFDNETFDFGEFNYTINNSTNLNYNNTNIFIETRNSSNAYEIFVIFKSTLELIFFEMIP